MSPIELIKQGYEDQDWGLIAQSYLLLTGQDLQNTGVPTTVKTSIVGKPKPVKPKPVKPKLKKPRSQKFILVPTPRPPLKKNSDKNKSTFCGKTPQFVSLPSTEAEKKEAKKLYKNMNWTAKGRRKPSTIDKINCCKCGKMFHNVPKILATKASSEDKDSIKYVCNGCIGG